MRTIERSRVFKRYFKRALAAPHNRKDLKELLIAVLDLLADYMQLPARNHDHPLSGAWAGYRDCHIKPDLLLIYAKPDAITLQLARLATHSEVFG